MEPGILNRSAIIIKLPPPDANQVPNFAPTARRRSSVLPCFAAPENSRLRAPEPGELKPCITVADTPVKPSGVRFEFSSRQRNS